MCSVGPALTGGTKPLSAFRSSPSPLPHKQQISPEQRGLPAWVSWARSWVGSEALVWELLGASVEHRCDLTSVQPGQSVPVCVSLKSYFRADSVCCTAELCSPVKGTARGVLTNLELQHEDYWWPLGVLPYARCRCTGAHTITICYTTIIKIHMLRADPERVSESCASWCGPLKDPTAL